MDIDVNKIPKVDVLTAGFPCQPFSVAGNRKGFNDDRGNHFFRILDFIDTIRPKFVFLENVKNLVGHDGGNTFKVIENEIKKRDYSFDSKVINTKDFGNIPHNRERIFIFSVDKTYCQDITFNFPDPEELTRGIQDIIENNPVDEPFYYREDKYMFPMLKEAITKKIISHDYPNAT